MSAEQIIVRVTLDSYDMASTGKQTQVYVQIPEVARASWLLPSEVFHGLKDRAWPEVLDMAGDYITYGGAASNSSSTAAWRAVRVWLRDDANRDEMQAAGELDQARRNPVARRLLAENERLRAALGKAESELTGTNLSLWEEEQVTARLQLALLSAKRGRRALRARVSELEANNPHTPRLCICGHSPHAHTVPAPHSCFAFGQTCPCPTYRQLPHDEAEEQFKQNLRAAEERQREQERAIGSADKLTALFAPVQALREDPHDGPLSHSYRVGRDLPSPGGAS